MAGKKLLGSMLKNLATIETVNLEIKGRTLLHFLSDEELALMANAKLLTHTDLNKTLNLKVKVSDQTADNPSFVNKLLQAAKFSLQVDDGESMTHDLSTMTTVLKVGDGAFLVHRDGAQGKSLFLHYGKGSSFDKAHVSKMAKGHFGNLEPLSVADFNKKEWLNDNIECQTILTGSSLSSRLLNDDECEEERNYLISYPNAIRGCLDEKDAVVVTNQEKTDFPWEGRSARINISTFTTFGFRSSASRITSNERYAAFILHHMNLSALKRGNFAPYMNNLDLYASVNGKVFAVTGITRGMLRCQSPQNKTVYVELHYVDRFSNKRNMATIKQALSFK